MKAESEVVERMVEWTGNAEVAPDRRLDRSPLRRAGEAVLDVARREL